jgi:peptidoglycan/LPS O-acetylase OafA/YrhL
MTHDFIFKEYWLQLFWIGNGVVLLIVSWLSYELIEKRFLRLKKYFEYQDTTSTKQRTGGVAAPVETPAV